VEITGLNLLYSTANANDASPIDVVLPQRNVPSARRKATHMAHCHGQSVPTFLPVRAGGAFDANQRPIFYSTTRCVCQHMLTGYRQPSLAGHSLCAQAPILLR